MFGKFSRFASVGMIVAVLGTGLIASPALAAKSQPTLIVSGGPNATANSTVPANGTAYVSGCGYSDGPILVQMFDENMSVSIAWTASASGGCFSSSHQVWGAGTYDFWDYTYQGSKEVLQVVTQVAVQ